jgi:hypothetical protein
MELQAVGLGAVAERLVGKHRALGQELGPRRQGEALVVPVVDVADPVEETVGLRGGLDRHVADLVERIGLSRSSLALSAPP